MSVADIREKIIADVEVGNEDLLQKIAALIEDYRAVKETSFGEVRDKKIAETRGKHIRGERRTYTPEEVRLMAVSKTRPSDV